MKKRQKGSVTRSLCASRLSEAKTEDCLMGLAVAKAWCSQAGLVVVHNGGNSQPVGLRQNERGIRQNRAMILKVFCLKVQL